MKTIKDNILEKIHTENISPRDRKFFVFQEVLLWAATVVFLIAASFAAGSLILILSNKQVLPVDIAWVAITVRIVLLVIFIAFIVYHVMRIDGAYRKSRSFYITLGLVITCIIGSALFATRGASLFERTLGSHGFRDKVDTIWSQPKNGLLAGEFVEAFENELVVLKDLEGELHFLDIRHLSFRDYENFIDHLRVQTVGYVSEGIFYPCMVIPLHVKRAAPEKSQFGRIHDRNQFFGPEDLVSSPRDRFTQLVRDRDYIIEQQSCDI